MTRVAFHAPLKPPDHPTPSGDRRMARLFIEALRRAGHTVEIASTLRTRDGTGDEAVQAETMRAAATERARLIAAWDRDPPALWFTYHCYYKAPDLLGPILSERFGIPYVIAEASRARKRLDGPWAGYARASEAAVDRADLLLAMTAHDRAALDRDAPAGQRIVDFPPFLDPGPDPAPKAASDGLRLLTVAMMRGGDKLASYRALSDALAHLDRDWTLTVVGDGPEREAVEAALGRYRERVRYLGQVADAARLRALYEAADVVPWPGVNEAYGMVYLEAQAAGTPVVAEDRPGPRSVVAPASMLVSQGDAAGFSRAVEAVATRPDAGRKARAHVLARHGVDAAAQRLAALLGDLT